MSEQLSQSAPMRFGRFELLPFERRLLLEGVPVALGTRALDVLVLLAQRAGQLVSKQELLDRVWGNLVVEENNLSVQISALRKILGPDLIATIPGRGFRFTARSVDAVSPAEAKPATPADAPSLRSSFPRAIAALIGRDDDLAALSGLCAGHRLVTIVGSGGIGKTRLAQSLLDAGRTWYPHGVAWVELAPLRDAGQVAAAITAALDVQSGSSDPLATLKAALAPLQILIGLDNAEHLVEGVARVVQSLLDAAPGLRLVVTSQVPLKIGAERVYRLRGLDVPEAGVGVQDAMGYGAIALFVERAQAADPRFKLTDDKLASVIEVCRRLDGTALAIELAAARVPVLGVRQLADALDERFRVLTAGQRAAPGRQQTLRAALSWSHDLLGQAERAVFRRLGVFVGSFALELAVQVASDADGPLDRWAVVEALATLVERSLVDVDGQDPPRYRLLDTPRAFALEQLETSGEAGAVRRRHARALGQWLLEAYEDHVSGVRSFDQSEQRYRGDVDDGRAALAWALENDAELAVALAPCLSVVMHNLPLADRALMWDQTEALMDDSMPAAIRARWLSERGNLRNYGDRAGYLSRGIALLRELGMRRDLYMSLRQLSFIKAVAAGPGDVAQAQAALDEMRAIEDPAWPPALRYWRLLAEGDVASGQGDFERAVAVVRQCIELTDQAGNTREYGWSQVRLQDRLVAAGQADEVIANGATLLARLREVRHARAFEMASLNLAAAHLKREDPAPVRDIAAQGWPLSKLFGSQAEWADYFALLAALEGRPSSAARLVGFSEAAYRRRAGDPQQYNEARAVRRAAELARARLGADEFERLRGEGEKLGEDEVGALAFDTVDSAGSTGP